MAAVEVPQSFKYRGGQLNDAPILEVENFTNWKKRFMCHIISIEPQFENIIKNGPFIPMTAGQRKPENEWTRDERKAANLDQRLKSLIMSILLDDQMNYLEINTGFINGLPKKWLSFCQSLRSTNNVKDSKLASLFGKLKYGENLIDNIYETEKNKFLVFETPLSTAFFSSSIVQEFQDSPDDEEDTRSSHEYLNDLEEEYQAIALLAKSKIFFKKAEYNKVKAKIALLSLSASASKSSKVKNKGLIAEAYEWDDEEVSLDDNEMVEVKVLMALAKENDFVSKKGAKNGEWVKISIRKCDIRKPIWYLDSGCLRHMTGVKSYLHKYLEQSGPKVVYRDDSTCTTEGYGCIKCKGIVFIKLAFVNGLKYSLISISQLCNAKYIVQFNEKRGTIFNSNKEFVMIAPRVRDVYVLDMTSSAQESCFFAKASKNLNWLWHKRLAHLNFKIINKLTKQNLVVGLPSLVYSKDKRCSSCEKGKHHRASFKTKHTFSIKKCLHLLHMDLFKPVTPRFINHEKYTFVIIDEYSRYTWVYFLKRKSQAPKTIMSFIKRVENQNDIKVKQLRTDNGTEFRNSILINFCDEKGISQNFSSPYTPEQNGVAERNNRTLIEAARTMLSGSRIPNISFLHVFGCPVYIHNHKDHLGKFDEKADDGYLLGYSLVSKAFRVFKTRRQQIEETYHIIFDESHADIKFSKPLVDNINIAETERYPPNEYLHPYKPSQRYQTNTNGVYFIEPYEYPKPVVLETKVSSDQNGQTNQDDQTTQNDEILNDDHSEHSNHTNDEQIIDNLPNTKDIQISEHLSTLSVEDTST
ncbi:retrovirus-related pol polyprotein from transposon TNT 1-94 [Tanacetum coccineum]